MSDKFRKFKLGILMMAAIIGGGLAGMYGTKEFGPTYSPISYVSVGVVQNTVPGVEGGALHLGDQLHYTHAICLSQHEVTRVEATFRWHEYEPVSMPPRVDPLLNRIVLNLPPGCERPDSLQDMPNFITPGVWSLEVEIKAKNGGDSQTVQLITTRFTVLPKEN